MPLLERSRNILPSVSVCTDVAGHWITFLSNGSGGVSNMRIFTLKATLPQQNYSADKRNVLFCFNDGRTHQSLGYSTPDKIYRIASGGGARIVNKYSKYSKQNKQTVELTEKEGQRLPAA